MRPCTKKMDKSNMMRQWESHSMELGKIINHKDGICQPNLIPIDDSPCKNMGTPMKTKKLTFFCFHFEFHWLLISTLVFLKKSLRMYARISVPSSTKFISYLVIS